MKITTCLLLLLNQERGNTCELVSSLSAYKSICIVYLEQNFLSYMISMVVTKGIYRGADGHISKR